MPKFHQKMRDGLEEVKRWVRCQRIHGDGLEVTINPGSCLIEPDSDPLVVADHVDTFRDDSICHLERVWSSYHIEEKIRNGQRSRFFVGVAEQEYVVQNSTDTPTVFVVRHDVPEGWIVDSNPQPTSVDGSTALFRLNAEPGQRVRLHVGMHRSDPINAN